MYSVLPRSPNSPTQISIWCTGWRTQAQMRRSFLPTTCLKFGLVNCVYMYIVVFHSIIWKDQKDCVFSEQYEMKIPGYCKSETNVTQP